MAPISPLKNTDVTVLIRPPLVGAPKGESKVQLKVESFCVVDMIAPAMSLAPAYTV